MKQKYFYSSESALGSSSSMGFRNDTIVRVWETKQARDEYIKSTPNISAKAILRSEVTTQATNYCLTQNKHSKPNPLKGEFWGICKDDYSCFVDYGYSGYIGTVEYGTEDSHLDLIRRFYLMPVRISTDFIERLKQSI
jgi:hypothetical protein